MLYVNWRVILIALLALMLVSTPWLISLWGRNRSRKWRRYASLSASPLTLAGGGILLLLFAVQSCSSYSEPMPASEGSYTARLDTSHGLFSTDGATVLTVYRRLGLSSATAYAGQWRSVEPTDIRWTAPSTLHVRYDDPDGHCNPHPASWFTVECDYDPALHTQAGSQAR